MIMAWLRKRAEAARAEEAKWDKIRSDRWQREAAEGRRNEAEALEKMLKAFEPLSEDERREITLRVALDDRPRGNSSGTWTEQASRYGECARIANSLTLMRQSMEPKT